MSEQISSLVDGELDGDGDIDRVLRDIGGDAARREQWDAYHLIGDTLRATHASGLRREEFARRLNAEPTILAPRQSRSYRTQLSRWPGRIAASVAAIAFVGWSMGTFFDAPNPSNPLAGTIVRPSFVSTGATPVVMPPGSGAPIAAHPIQQLPMTGSANAGVHTEPLLQSSAPVARVGGANAMLDDYVWAHQRYSPASLVHDVAPYVRLISAGGAGR